MRVAIVYTGITSYMTDCWRELAQRQDVELRIWIEDTKTYRFKGDRDRALQGLNCKWEYSENLTDDKLADFEDEIVSFSLFITTNDFILSLSLRIYYNTKSKDM